MNKCEAVQFGPLLLLLLMFWLTVLLFSIAQRRREEHRNAYNVMCVHIVQRKRSPAELINHISSIDQSEWGKKKGAKERPPHI